LTSEKKVTKNWRTCSARST